MSFDPHTLATMADQRAQRWHMPVSPEITQAIARTAELVFDYNADMRTAGWEIAHPIVVGKQAWLGAGVIVLPGATIAYGNPARIIRTANPHTTYEL